MLSRFCRSRIPPTAKISRLSTSFRPQRPFTLSSTSRYPVYIKFGGGTSSTPPPPHSSGPKRVLPEWNRPTTFCGIIIVTFGIWYLAHLEQVPETGRWRYITMSPDQEAKMAKWIDGREGHSPQLPLDHPITLKVHRVVDRLLEANNLGRISETLVTRASDRSGFVDLWDPTDSYSTASESRIQKRSWEVRVIPDNRIVNAAALPGIIMVYTGILPICRDDQGLAAVLSHEIGHVVARHTAERLSSAILFYPIALVTSVLFSNTTWLGDLVFTYVLQNPNGRTQEREADVIGMRMMAKACFDPQASPEMFKRLGAFEAQHGGKNIEFLSTHPKSENRVRYLENMLPEAHAIRADASCPELGQSIQRFANITGMRGPQQMW
ncbi:peptidase family M48-domain-containing protein [Flagelloscypha sp. PMI_526]|nr:peptidase family M48-domain-containing protein [Flagelloscypha sp. PMI_526]